VRIRLIDRVFSPGDLAAIEAAVRDVESRSPGEVVPYAVDHSDAYHDALWTVATLGSLLGGLLTAALDGAFGGWRDAPAASVVGLPAAGAALGYLLASVWPELRLRLVPAHTVDHRVQQRAVAAFVEQEVFRTRARTGVLVFLSLRERRVVILADTGISARVEQREWDTITAGIVAGMRRAEPGPALASAIRRCGELLAAHGLGTPPRSRNELSDELRRRPE
jgi:putative membrane protein